MLDPAGVGAETVADLWWVMLAGAVVIWIVVIGLSVYAAYVRPGHRHEIQRTRLLIVGGGAVVPTAVLCVLLAYGLWLLPRVAEALPPDGIRLHVVGERWWWRMIYTTPDGREVPLANEVRLPVGEPTVVSLSSPDVIHSLWIPPIAGKVDMIPGRVNHMVLRPTRTGVFRGACAEYCGTSHALMNFGVVVMEKDAFEAWLAVQAQPAAAPQTPEARRGATLFLAYGCSACHTVRGTPADGALGPDLTHVGSRISLGAGILPNDVPAFRRWIAETHAVKPDVNMPAFGMLADDELTALAHYLDGLT